LEFGNVGFTEGGKARVSEENSVGARHPTVPSLLLY